MNTNSIRLFAKNARINLCKAVEHRIKYWGFDDDGHPQTQPVAVSGGDSFRGEVYNDTMVVGLWQNLKNRLSTGENTLQDTIEEAAYTWFNRLVAIKILEENNFIPPVLRFREGSLVPEILQKAKAGEHSITHSGKIESLQKALGDNDDEKALAILITDFCNKNPLLSEVFGKLDDYTQILLPQNLLAADGFLAMLNDEKNIRPEDYREVELIGWLYQFYISDRKDEVFDGFKKNKKARPEDIPAATQIFTPKWIVSYMVENTLGKAYIDYEPDTPLKEQMKYLVEDQNTDHQPLIEDITELSLIDPAAGSGHILVVGFEWLYQMYIEQGYAPKNAAKAIIEHNLFGLDIDERAAQLARFAVLLKAALLLEKRMIGDGRSFLAEKSVLLPHIYAFPEVYHFSMEEVGLFTQGRYTEEITAAIRLLQKGKNIGSALRLSLSAEAQAHIKQQMTHWDSTPLDIEQEVVYKHLRPYLAVALTLAQRYTAVVANPPYMGSTNMNAELKAYLEKNYPITKSDLCTVFVEMFPHITVENGKYAFIIPPSWMFLSSYENLRYHIFSTNSIDSLLHLSRGVFGADFGSVSCVITNAYSTRAKGTYFRLIERTFQEFYQGHLEELFLKTLENPDFKYDFSNYDKDLTELEYSEKGNTIFYPHIPQDQFEKIPGSPIAYWVSDKVREIFEKNQKLGEVGEAKAGLQTGDNNRFLRLWNEVSFTKIGYNMANSQEALESKKKWFPCNKGGEVRKWYGNQEYLVNWENDGYEIKDLKNAVVRNPNYYFRECISWGLITSGGSSFRYFPKGFIFDISAVTYFIEKKEREILGVLNSKYFLELSQIINPTINFSNGVFALLPALFTQNEKFNKLVEENIDISKEEWDSKETSWNFEKLSLIDGKDLKTAYENYCNHWRDNFVQLHKNEEELNRLFIEIYDLQDEMDEKVAFEDITILKKEAKIVELDNSISKNFSSESEKYLYDRGVNLEFNKDELIKQFLSYAVGCIMGRYSINKAGLIIANSDDILELSENKFIVKGTDGEIRQEVESKFLPDEDAIIPVMGSSCAFPDDMVRRIEDLIHYIWGDENATENFNFINRSLGMPLEKWLTENFWEYHTKMYSKRPIYWLFCSNPKSVAKSAFRVLVYMHRMDAYTVQQIMRQYLYPHQEYLRKEYEDLLSREASLDKEEKRRLDAMPKLINELKEYSEQLKEYANQQIVIDLDDGVKQNYAKFKGILAVVK